MNSLKYDVYEWYSSMSFIVPLSFTLPNLLKHFRSKVQLLSKDRNESIHRKGQLLGNLQNSVTMKYTDKKLENL